MGSGPEPVEGGTGNYMEVQYTREVQLIIWRYSTLQDIQVQLNEKQNEEGQVTGDT